MAHFYNTSEINPELIKSSKVAVLGYGNQGHAHALNLRDNGVKVMVGAREGSSRGTQALEAGFTVGEVRECIGWCDVAMFTLPDVQMAKIYKDEVAPFLREGQQLLFAHGFNIHYGYIKPPSFVDVGMVSPKGPGHGLRSEYLKGSGLAALVAVHQDATGTCEQRTLSYAWGLGCARTMVLRTSFKEETECDLFGEQAVLCGGLVELVKAGYETLVEAGYEPEAAYFECLHETKLIVDLLVSRGLAGMRQAISDTAEYGGYIAGPRVVNESSREAMRGLLADIQSGKFADELVSEVESGGRRFQAFRDEEAGHPAEAVGAVLREKMPFLKELIRGR